MSQAPLFYCVIPGRPIVKKNSRTIARHGGRLSLRPSAKFMQWAQGAAVAVKQAAVAQSIRNPLEGELEADFTFYLKDRQSEPDTSNLIEGPQDILQAVGVIGNDKQVVRLRAEKIFGHEPQTVVVLRKLTREEA